MRHESKRKLEKKKKKGSFEIRFGSHKRFRRRTFQRWPLSALSNGRDPRKFNEHV